MSLRPHCVSAIPSPRGAGDTNDWCIKQFALNNEIVPRGKLWCSSQIGRHLTFECRCKSQEKMVSIVLNEAISCRSHNAVYPLLEYSIARLLS